MLPTVADPFPSPPSFFPALPCQLPQLDQFCFTSKHFAEGKPCKVDGDSEKCRATPCLRSDPPCWHEFCDFLVVIYETPLSYDTPWRHHVDHLQGLMAIQGRPNSGGWGGLTTPCPFPFSRDAGAPRVGGLPPPLISLVGGQPPPAQRICNEKCLRLRSHQRDFQQKKSGNTERVAGWSDPPPSLRYSWPSLWLPS